MSIQTLLSVPNQFVIFRIILDGEMLVWDPVSERNLPFGTLKTAALASSYDLITGTQAEFVV